MAVAGTVIRSVRAVGFGQVPVGNLLDVHDSDDDRNGDQHDAGRLWLRRDLLAADAHLAFREIAPREGHLHTVGVLDFQRVVWLTHD